METRHDQAIAIISAMIRGERVEPRFCKPEDFGGISAKEYTLGYFVNHPDRFVIISKKGELKNVKN